MKLTVLYKEQLLEGWWPFNKQPTPQKLTKEQVEELLTATFREFANRMGATAARQRKVRLKAIIDQLRLKLIGLDPIQARKTAREAFYSEYLDYKMKRDALLRKKFSKLRNIGEKGLEDYINPPG